VATLDTPHYAWLGFGHSEEEAAQAIKTRFFNHVDVTEEEWCEENGVNDWMEYMDPRVVQVRPGEGYLDAEDTNDYRRQRERAKNA